MKMMVVGGKRSREYAGHIQNQFSIATSVLAGLSLEDVERMAVLGNMLERVLVLEQAWTMDGVSASERDMRKRICDMARQARDRGSTEQYVFMARTPESAKMCYEETYDICDRVAIVLYTQSVTVVILHELLAGDIAALRPALVYNPPATERVDIYMVEVEAVQDMQEASVETVKKRIITKTRGAAIQRKAGEIPWYAAQQQNGGGQMEVINYNPQDLFAPMQKTSADRGFSDTAPFVAAGAVDMSGQLQRMFKNTGNPFAQQTMPPEAVIPVTPAVPVSMDMSAFIRAKARRGDVLVFLGVGGSGTTFMALNCAARLYSAGFSVLFIDGDLTGHSVQYLTRLGVSGDVLVAEVEGRTLRPGFDLYGVSQFMSLDGRFWEIPSEIAGRYDFIVVDLPLCSALPAGKVLCVSKRIAVTVESSNWGIGKAALALFNAPVEVMPYIRERSRLIFNRSDKLSSGLFGTPVYDDAGIKRKVEEVFGARASTFTAIPAVSIVGSYTSAEEYWFSDKLFSDSAEGAVLFDGILQGLLA